MSLSTSRRRTAGELPDLDIDMIAISVALDAVDAALRQVRHRRRLTRAEATALLGDVRRDVGELGRGPDATTALDGAVDLVCRESTVDARPVVDALLDVRLAVAGRH
jgi:hypothetical protein